MASPVPPHPIPELLRALSEHDLRAVRAAFTPGAEIRDEREVLDAEQWATRVFGYDPAFTVDDVVEARGETVVTMTVAGEYAGSPLAFRWHVTLADDRIAALRIALATAPTVVLVHGAFAESASWNGVIEELDRRGHRTLAVANPLRGLQADAAYLRSVVDSIPGPVVLAGHSYGGSVIGEAAEGAANVTALVYVASFQLEPGESTAELAAKFPGGQLGPALEPAPFPAAGGEAGTDLYIKQEQFHAVFAADVAPETAALMAVTQRPIAGAALEDAATKAAWTSIPSWSLVTRQDLAIPLESMRFMSARAGSTTVEIDASHAVTVSQPGAVAELIDDAARATARERLDAAAA